MTATIIITRLLLEDQGVEAEIYPIIVPEKAKLPAVVITQIHEDQNVVLNGATAAFESRVTTSCLATSPDEVMMLGEAVKRALESVIHWEVDDGNSPPRIWGTATIWKAGNDMTDYSDDRSVFRRNIDWYVRWTRND